MGLKMTLISFIPNRVHIYMRYYNKQYRYLLDSFSSKIIFLHYGHFVRFRRSRGGTGGSICLNGL